MGEWAADGVLQQEQCGRYEHWICLHRRGNRHWELFTEHLTEHPTEHPTEHFTEHLAEHLNAGPDGDLQTAPTKRKRWNCDATTPPKSHEKDTIEL